MMKRFQKELTPRQAFKSGKETITVRDTRNGKDYQGEFKDAEEALDFFSEKLNISPVLLDLVDYWCLGVLSDNPEL